MNTVEKLKSKALNYWPVQIAEIEKKGSIIPRLIETQDKFISLLNISDSNPYVWEETLENTKSLTPNLFLKHLIVLSDIGGERLKRFRTDIEELYPNHKLDFIWNEEEYSYKFQSIEDGYVWSNKNLYVDGDSLLDPVEMTKEMKDVTMLLLFGGLSIVENIPHEIENKCMIGSLLGKKDKLDTFVRQRYIWVSRITGGATANTMGYLAENYVSEHLKSSLKDWDFSGSHIPGISQNEGRTPIGFDIVAISPKGNYCAVEVSFQVTTNSTIERKAGQARSRMQQLQNAGHNIAYVIDGAGNFERSSALRTIINHSDITVTFSENELDSLVEFLKNIDED